MALKVGVQKRQRRLCIHHISQLEPQSVLNCMFEDPSGLVSVPKIFPEPAWLFPGAAGSHTCSPACSSAFSEMVCKYCHYHGRRGRRRPGFPVPFPLLRPSKESDRQSESRPARSDSEPPSQARTLVVPHALGDCCRAQLCHWNSPEGPFCVLLAGRVS